MNDTGTQATAHQPAGDAHFRLQVAGPMRYDIWLSDTGLRFKQGMRRGDIALADVTHFGLKRIAGDRTSLTELRLVTPSKTHKLPFHTGDDQAHALLAALRARRPEADLSDRPWGEAAPLIGIKPFGLRDYFAQPMAAAGLMMLVLAGPATMILNELFPTWSPPSTRSIAMVGVMVIGVVLMGIAWVKHRGRQKREASGTTG